MSQKIVQMSKNKIVANEQKQFIKKNSSNKQKNSSNEQKINSSNEQKNSLNEPKNSSNEQNIVQISKMDNLWIHLNYILAYPIDSFEEFSVSILFLAHLNFSVLTHLNYF